jgi:hypothetical protein
MENTVTPTTSVETTPQSNKIKTKASTVFSSIMSFVGWFVRRSRFTFIISFSLIVMNLSSFLLGVSNLPTAIVLTIIGFPACLISLLQWLSARGLLELSEHYEQFQELYAAYLASSGKPIELKTKSSLVGKANAIVPFAKFVIMTSPESIGAASEIKGYILSLFRLFNPAQMFLFAFANIGLWAHVIFSCFAAIYFL